jgi:transcriptional regulator with XRE-family HTH domain
MNTYATLLDGYLGRPENSEAELAVRLGKPQPTINRYRNGRRFPDAETARLIDAATGGEVSFDVWQAVFLARAGLGEAA